MDASGGQHLLSPFEGREAIYVEKGALRVRVYDIRLRTNDMSARLEELPTPGLGFAMDPNPTTADKPRKWRIGTSKLADPSFSTRCWMGGAYSGWSLYFDPEIVSGVVKLATLFPPNLPRVDGYRQFLKFVLHHHVDDVKDQELPLFRE